MTTKIDPSIIKLAQDVQRQWGIPAAVALAQYRIESANGTRFTGTWNCWGIKALDGEHGTTCWTHEVINGKSVMMPLKFRDYATLALSFDAYGKLLAKGKPYADARAALPDQDKFIDLMAKRYATGPSYASLIKQVIAGSNLNQYNVKDTHHVA